MKRIVTSLRRNLSNIPGWRTNRKIVVIESDDWGSIRMSSKESFEELKSKGIIDENCNYSKYDSLESNDDLSALLELLNSTEVVEKKPIFTNVSIMANPNFEKIRESNFTNYYYEDFRETLRKYPSHDKVFHLTLQGIEEKLIVPVFHGREHLNVQRWMSYLQNNNKSIHKAFEFGVTGIRTNENGNSLRELQAAFDIDEASNLNYLEKVLQEGLEIFESIFGFSSAYFVPTNGPFNNSLEKVLFEGGVKFINSGKVQIEPLGGGQYNRNFRFLGQRNNYNQRYITRNCFFEPSSNHHFDWVDSCLKEIEIAFRWKKPAVISTHRVNYIGFLVESNRKKSLLELKRLLNAIIKKWPDVEFMNSVELGEAIIRNTEKGNGEN
jgi:hypothetical protein